MACCAFAAFLLVQLLAPFRALRRGRGVPVVAANRAVAWRLDGTTAVAGSPAPRRRSLRAVFAGCVVVELLLGFALLGSASPSRGVAPADAASADAAWDDWRALVALHTLWCSTDVAPPLDRSH